MFVKFVSPLEIVDSVITAEIQDVWAFNLYRENWKFCRHHWYNLSFL